MGTMTTLQATVTDTNHHLRGVMTLQVEFDQDRPWRVIHEGRRYAFTGKEGHHLATGRPTREMATDEDARLWIALDGTAVWED